jgi:PIN domain nuclease of toxin-antitoxin system
VVLAKVARKCAREGVEERIMHTRLQQIEDASNIVGLDAELALEATKCYSAMEADAKKRKLTPPSLFDAVVLATGKLLEAKILTGDQHFKGLAETLWLE